MNDRVRALLLGVGLGVAPLLLLDLAATLGDAVARDPATSAWWPVACYVATGLLVAVGVAAGRRDRTVAIAASVVVAVASVPALPLGADWLGRLPLASSAAPAGAASVLLVCGAYLYAAVRGPKA